MEQNSVITVQNLERIALSLVTTAIYLTIIYACIKWRYKYWARKKIPFKDPELEIASLFSNTKEAIGVEIRRLYDTAKAAGFKEYGLFWVWKPIYLVIDPQIIKNILSIDFQSFSDRGCYFNKKADPLSANLYSHKFHEWKKIRMKLTPIFTSEKMKTIIPAVVECGDQLKRSMDHLTSLNDPINIRDISAQFITDVGASCAFGNVCNSIINPNSDFMKYSKQVVSGRRTIFSSLKFFFHLWFPKFADKIGIILTYPENNEFFLRIVKETVEYRKKNKIIRNDLLQLLIDLKNEESHLTLEEISAQAYIFFFAGLETSATTIMFFLYELSQNLDIQEKIRDEINNVLEKYDGKVTYDAVMEMNYMKQAIDETLRKYPPMQIFFRQSVEDYKLPGREAILEKGTTVLIPCVSLHYDSEYFPNPEKFDPDRFSDENKHKINLYTYLPFGEGPRNCISFHFAIMQVKVGLIYLVKNYKFSPNEKTPTPLVMDPSSHILQPTGGLWLNVAKVE